VTEPVYEFVKGQGWVVSNGIIAETRDGVRARLFVRPAQPGESFFNSTSNSDMPFNIEHVNAFDADAWDRNKSRSEGSDGRVVIVVVLDEP
jgi:hypothetical protein